MKMKPFLRACALVLCLTLLLPQTFAANAGPAKLQTSWTIQDNLTYIHTVSDHLTLGRLESFSLELAPGGSVRPILVQADDTIYYAATLSHAVALAQSHGYQVLGAINADFFSTATGIPLGLVIEDGIYRSSNDTESAVIFTDEGIQYIQDPNVTISLENRTAGSGSIQLRHYNKLRQNGGGLYLLSSDLSTISSRTSGAGWYVKLRILEGEMTVSGTMLLEVAETVRLEGSFPLEDGYLYLTAGDISGLDAAFDSFRVGDLIDLTTRCRDEALAGARWATGCGDLLVWDGALADSSGWAAELRYTAPRTALGVKADGTLVCYVVDGRRLGYSMGLPLADLAEEMLRQGCVWAVNLDGGGSSTASVRLPGWTGCQVVNRPSDNSERRCASFLLLVAGEVPASDGVPVGLTLDNHGALVLPGTSFPLGQAVFYDQSLAQAGGVEDLIAASRTGLGTVSYSDEGELIYSAGEVPGTDTITLYSPSTGLRGSAQIHIISQLSELGITVNGQAAGASLTLKAGEQVQLGGSGRYWGYDLLPAAGSFTCTLEGEIGALDPSGQFTAGYLNGTGSITLSAGGLSRTLPVTVYNLHEDVTSEDWSYAAVEYCYGAGLVSGVTDTTFGKDEAVLRGDFILMLYRAAGMPQVSGLSSFTDVTEEDYYAAAIAWAQENQIASGIGEGAFGAQQAITRQDAFTIISRVLPLLGVACQPGSEEALALFEDAGEIADYARVPIATLVEQRIVSGGEDGLLSPTGLITREQIAVVFYQCSIRAAQPDVPDPPDTADVPENPDIPETPDTPENPDEPSAPGDLDVPGDPDVPGNPDASENPDAPENPDKPDEPNVPEETGGQDTSDTLDTPQA